jgi:acetoin utilization deacetylase AcuC-like enzyme
MPTLFISHPDCEKHVMLEHHPESPARLQHIQQAVAAVDWQGKVQAVQAREIGRDQFAGIHPEEYLAMLESLDPGEGIARVDADTSLNQHSLRAARLAAGSVVQAVDAVMAGTADNAFCAIRPPGHHAETALPLGFCIYNNIALAAEHALALGAQRIAIFDFDVHHGNGTVEIFRNRPEVMVCSSFQYPFYPGRFDDVDAENIVLTPLDEGTASSGFRQAIERDWLAAVAAHQPDLILVSAGFDAHREDPMAGLLLEDEDFRWVTDLLVDAASRYCGGRLVSALEGGYHLQALARSATLHLQGLSH